LLFPFKQASKHTITSKSKLKSTRRENHESQTKDRMGVVVVGTQTIRKNVKKFYNRIIKQLTLN
jgi:hypothetical protein